MLHPVEVALEAQAIRIGLLVAGTPPRADRARRAGCETFVERGFPDLAPLHPPPDERQKNLLHLSIA